MAQIVPMTKAFRKQPLVAQQKVSQLVELLGPSGARFMVDTFILRSGDGINALHRCHQTENTRCLLRIAGAIKDSAGHVGAQQLHLSCASLEALVNSGVDGAPVQIAIEELVQLFEQSKILLQDNLQRLAC